MHPQTRSIINRSKLSHLVTKMAASERWIHYYYYYYYYDPPQDVMLCDCLRSCRLSRIYAFPCQPFHLFLFLFPSVQTLESTSRERTWSWGGWHDRLRSFCDLLSLHHKAGTAPYFRSGWSYSSCYRDAHLLVWERPKCFCGRASNWDAVEVDNAGNNCFNNR